MQNSNHRPTEIAYGELQQAYDHYNLALFDNTLPQCLLTFQREKRTMGYFSSKRFVRVDRQVTDEIAMNPEYFAAVPLVEVLQTLVHEMTHLWQYTFGTPSRSGYHNGEWAKKMKSIGLVPSDTGRPGGKFTGQRMADYVEPGGRFEEATLQLLQTGFAISWFDRFPVKLQQPTWSMQQAVEPINLASEAMWPEPDIGGSSKLTAHDVALIFTTAPAADFGEAIGEHSSNRSNRLKYECPMCRIAVWGKPGLRISCTDCDMPLNAKKENP